MYDRLVPSWIKQLRPIEDTEEEEVADVGSGHLVCTYAAHDFRVFDAMVSSHGPEGP